MAHDGTTPNGLASKSATSTLHGQLVRRLDPNKVIVWDSADCLSQFHELTQNPPLHSLVVHIEPIMAEQLLLITNNKNRPLSPSWSKRMSGQIAEGYELTGDSIKFSKTGQMLDGQHRLDACVKTKSAIISHVVFGLDEHIFDVLDQGKKRTPGDICALYGVTDYNTVASAISWIYRVKDGLKGSDARLTPRQIGKLATGEMKGINDYVASGRLVNVAFKHPPSMIAAILYLISKHSPAVARDFAHEWVHGAKINRNENFNVLSQRLMTIAHQSGGHVNQTVRAALIVMMFNHWHAGIVASARSLTWKKTLKFPAFEFNKDAFKRKNDDDRRGDTSLSETQARVFRAMSRSADDDNKVQMSLSEIGERSNTPKGSVSYIVNTLVEMRMIKLVKPSENKQPPIYRIKAEDPTGVQA